MLKKIFIYFKRETYHNISCLRSPLQQKKRKVETRMSWIVVC